MKLFSTKNLYTLSLATCALALLASVGSSTNATAATNSGVVESEKAIANLTPADEFQTAVNEDVETSDEQAFAGPWGHGGGRPGGGYGPRPVPRPMPAPYYPRPRPAPRPYPVPVPRYPYPRPYPYPVPAPAPQMISCYARSYANGLTYYGNAYNSIDAQNIALNECFRMTGMQCQPLGCQ